jgi:hypothetical protein
LTRPRKLEDVDVNAARMARDVLMGVSKRLIDLARVVGEGEQSAAVEVLAINKAVADAVGLLQFATEESHIDRGKPH